MELVIHTLVIALGGGVGGYFGWRTAKKDIAVYVQREMAKYLRNRYGIDE